MTHTLTAGAARAGLLAAAALLFTCAAPAHATAERRPAADWLLLTVTPGDARADAPGTRPGTGTGATRGALLLCDPPRGHAHAARACADLDATDGRIDAIPARDAHCPMVHAPVTAHASGRWRGQPVDYTRTFPNACVLAASTGAVFAWDREG
ncbi:serine protease [Streptomyces ambofaciens]|uniref:Serine protease n=1 Tax=Streptomyces ambofaciens TaxID=1889 RepID=A0ABM6B4W2_STRAM|nr:SSI family serine proteinase inhibitor [Streptomyces ambofaciens]ANB09248.1 serine protease [Streptomyces ambofaciens]